jgi:hypothetical protein
MSRAVVFVHGTGVRGESYARTFALIKDALADGTSFSGCFWGDAEGARLRANGVSVPRYEQTRRAGAVEEELALWAVLYTDPWYELRLLRYAGDEVVNLPPGTVSASVALRQQVRAFAPSVQLRAEWDRAGLAGAFDDAVAALVASPEFDEAAETAAADLVDHRKAVARAVVAYALVATEAPVDGENRDALVERLTDELHGYGKGIGEWLARPFKGVAARTVTRLVGRRRGSVTDAVAPAAGDILRYQARGQGIRDSIRQAIADTRADRVALLAHSLGGIAGVDLLVANEIPQVDRLITVGSQAPFLYEIGALTSLEPPDPLPGHFPSWLNIYDPRDFLGYVGQDVFPGRVTDVEVDNRQPFPQAHSAYWGNRAVWAAVSDFLV